MPQSNKKYLTEAEMLAIAEEVVDDLPTEVELLAMVEVLNESE